jgi:hypothetical protein
VADARVIPIGGDDGRPTRAPASAADAVAAGASRARGERSKRRPTPLLDHVSEPAEPDRDDPMLVDEPVVVEESVVVDEALGDVADVAEMPEWERKVAAALAFVRRRLTGDIEVDEFGFDAELTENVLLALVRPLYEHYFRVEVRGLENVPAEGGALVVANHSGTIPVDSVMTQVALLDHHPAHRHLRMLGADLVFQMPVVGEMARKTGTTLACQADAERLLHKGELVGVWPEGFKGIGKPFS